MARVGGEVRECQNEVHRKTSQDPCHQLSRAGLWISSKHVYAATTKVSLYLPCKTEETWWKGLTRPQLQWTELQYKTPKERDGGLPV